MVDAQAAAPEFRTAESLRALRRGLQRASGDFAVFFALFDRIELRHELVRRLEESMPDVALEEVHLNATTESPLADVLDQLDENAGGPVMIFGLERAVRMGSDDAPVLRALNLERAEWKRRLRRPVVFWIPKAILAAMGRTAPDFLDWRSDTLDLTQRPELSEDELIAFDSEPWRGGADNRIPRDARRARIEELHSRIQTLAESEDTEVEKRRARWLYELANHWFFLGVPQLADAAYRWAEKICETVGDRETLAKIRYQLGSVALQRGEHEEAHRWTRDAISQFEQIGDVGGAITSQKQLARIWLDRKDFEKAADCYEEVLAKSKKLGDRDLQASLQVDLGEFLVARGQFQEARQLLEDALVKFEQNNNRYGTSYVYYQLGLISEHLDVAERAREWYQKSLSLSVDLGIFDLAAITLSRLGGLALSEGRIEEALEKHIESFSLDWVAKSPADSTATASLQLERESLGDDDFEKIVRESSPSLEVAKAILKITGAPNEAESSPVHEVAEPAAVYGTGGRSDSDD